MLQSTKDKDYAERLVRLQTVWWKRWIDVQAPYRWNLQRIRPGFTLDVGCGIGRNLKNLYGNGVGIDHNADAVRIARSLGYKAYTPDEFANTEFNRPGVFDSLLMAHVAEHLGRTEAVRLIQQYVPLLKPHGKLILITPQEVGQRSDKTHVEFMDFDALSDVVRQVGFREVKNYSNPFPRMIGHLFIYNEFVSVSERPS